MFGVDGGGVVSQRTYRLVLLDSFEGLEFKGEKWEGQCHVDLLTDLSSMLPWIWRALRLKYGSMTSNEGMQTHQVHQQAWNRHQRTTT